MRADEEEEEELLRSVTLQNAQSILQARQRAEQELLGTKEALEEETRVLERLNEVGATLASKLDLESLVQAVIDIATELSGAELGAFFYRLNSDDGGEFALFRLTGAARELFASLGHLRATPMLAPTFRGEAVIRIGDVVNDPRYAQMGPHDGLPPGHLPVRSYLAVPVIARTGDVIGGLFLGHRDPNVFTQRSERVIVGIAAHAAIAIDNARLYEDVKRAANERGRLLAAERAARAELERLSFVKDEFLATLSHELRTPLNAVLGWADVLLSGPIEETSARHGLEAITRNARAQAQLIDDLLDVNRILSGKMRLDVRRLELVPTIEAAIDSVRPSADAKSIALRSVFDPDAGSVLGDPHRLHQVVWNLLTNAVKFTPAKGTIEVVLTRGESHVEITVRDSGIGIRPDFLPHLFERFRQADSSTTRGHGGLGIGLSLVKQLVELHGGYVLADSAGEGKGSTFIVRLPLQAAGDIGAPAHHDPTSAASPNAGGPDVSLSGMKILVVDDQLDARELLEFILSGAGAEVLSAGSAADGLSLVKSSRPDVIVSDVGMPDRDGYDFIRDVRNLAAASGGEIPAVAITAFARGEDRTKSLIAGFQAHVAKPVEPRELVAAIRALQSATRG